MNKRNFLQGLLIAVLAGGASASFAQSKAFAQDTDVQRYLETIQRQDHIIQLKEIKDSAEPSNQAFVQNQIDRKINELITYTMDHFKGDRNSPEARAAIISLFDGSGKLPDFDTMSVQGLQNLLDIAVPVAVVKSLIGRHKITFVNHDGPAFERFSNMYRDLIVA